MSAQTEREHGMVTDGSDPGTPGERLRGTAVPAHGHSRSAGARTIGAHEIARQLARVHRNVSWVVVDPHDPETILDRDAGA